MKSRVSTKILLLFFATFFLTTSISYAMPVSSATARVVAQNFIVHHVAMHGDWNGVKRPAIDSIELVTHNNMPVGYNVKIMPSGSLFVAYWDDFSPVIFYSPQSTFDPLKVNDPNAIESWIIPETYNNIQHIHSIYAANNVNPKTSVNTDKPVNVPGTIISRVGSKVAQAWEIFNVQPEAFTTPTAPVMAGAPQVEAGATAYATTVAPLLTTTWKQGNTNGPYDYNLYTPADPGSWIRSACDHTYTGCVATAMAQVMKYWNWPSVGTSSHSYTMSTIGTTLSADFNHAYHWSSMPSALTTSSTTTEIDAVARLMSDVGVSVDMDYTCNSSGAHETAIVPSLTTYFGYKNTAQLLDRANYATATDWMNVIKAELNAIVPRPMLLTIKEVYLIFPGGAHEVVIDGYQTSVTDQVHLNYGWGGTADSYYDITNNWTTGSYKWSGSNQYLVVGIEPLETLSVSLNANPSNGTAPLNGVDLTATASGTATGTINYTFYCNRSDTGTNITSPYDWKFDGVLDNPKTVIDACNYSSAGTYTAKVIAERGSALPAEARTSMTVNPTQQYILTVTKAGTGTGNVNATGCTLSWNGNTGTCTVNSGIGITLTGSANTGSTFAGWSGGTGSASCTGTGLCSFNINATSGVTATFNIQTCSYSIYPASQSFTSSGGTGSVSVTASGSSCAWTASSPLSWTTITLGSGTGSGTAGFTVSANTLGAGQRTGNITVAGQTFVITQSDTAFADVLSTNIFYNYINAIYNAHITLGCSQNPLMYCPDAGVTRGQMAAFIIRAKYGENFTYTQTPYFSDVPATNGFFKYVQRLKDDAITVVTGTYGVNDVVTRGQMAAFIIRAKYGENFTYTQTPYFSDVPATNVFFKYVQKMKDDCITVVTGTYGVNDVVTRGQMAAFIARAFLGSSGCYSISGRVTLNGSGLSGVTITLTGSGSASVITDSSGNYTLTGIQNGSYTVTPSRTGYTFTPSSQAVTINGANGTVPTFIASGTTAHAKLPDTGQTKCYDQTAGTEIACAGTGQDGAYNINPMSYTDNGNGTITDNNTGLMWQQHQDGIDYNWYQASGTYDAAYNPSLQNVCGSLTLGGYSNWRLPTKKELHGIVNYAIPWPNMSIDTVYFTNEPAAQYWTATTSSSNPSRAFEVFFGEGEFFQVPKDTRNLYRVRCVRGVESSPSFTNNGNGTVTDNGTGLMWQQGEPGIMTWQNALNYCNGLSLGSQTDWRLPNIKELESITDDAKYNPAIDTTYFPNTYAGYYFSSTTDTYWKTASHVVSFNDGTSNNWSISSYVRCVRGGQ